MVSKIPIPPFFFFFLKSSLNSLSLFFSVFIYLVLTVLGLQCCAGFSLVAASGSSSLVAVGRCLIVVASLVAEHRLYGAQAPVVVVRGLSRCGSWALEHMLSSCDTRA